jgi:hypothetical protein
MIANILLFSAKLPDYMPCWPGLTSFHITGPKYPGQLGRLHHGLPSHRECQLACHYLETSPQISTWLGHPFCVGVACQCESDSAHTRHLKGAGFIPNSDRSYVEGSRARWRRSWHYPPCGGSRLSEPHYGCCETKELRQKVSGLGWFCCPPGYGNGFYTNAKVIYL